MSRSTAQLLLLHLLVRLILFFVTRVAAAFVVPVLLFADAAFGEIFLSAI